MINDLEFEQPNDVDYDESRPDLSELWRDLQKEGRIPFDDRLPEY
jgi:hypothetical protein